MSVNKDDYYGILGVSCECNNNQIKSAFRQLAMQYHPDHNSSNKKAEQKFRKICEAYEILKDPQKRAVYNQFYHETFKDNDTTFESRRSQKNSSKKTAISEFTAYRPTIFLIALIIVLSVIKTPPELLPLISIHCLYLYEHEILVILKSFTDYNNRMRISCHFFLVKFHLNNSRNLFVCCCKFLWRQEIEETWYS